MNVDTDTQFAYLIGIRVSDLVYVMGLHSLIYSHVGFHYEKEGLSSDPGREP